MLQYVYLGQEREIAVPARPLGRRTSKGPFPQHPVDLHLGADVQHVCVGLLHGAPGGGE